MAKANELKTQVFSKKGSKKEMVSLNPDIFGSRVNKRLLDLIQTAYAANQRQGNASTKGRKEVRGGGKKPWRQKGTGRARVGSSRNPIWRGGGVVFGPKPRDYRVDLPKAMRLEALRSALSLKCKKEDIKVLEELSIATPKTKEFVDILKALKLEDIKTLCVVANVSDELKRATRNISGTKLITSKDVSAYDILRKRILVIEKSALPVLENRFSGESAGEEKQKGETKKKKAELAEV